MTEVQALAAEGLNLSQVSRATGISRSTIRNWLQGRPPKSGYRKRSAFCFRCGGREDALPEFTDIAYAYLLGMYLGDGSLATHPRGVMRLRISLDRAYPIIVAECEAAISVLLPRNKVTVISRWDQALDEVSCFSKHWMCLLPQHGVGMKHQRPIVLAPWQREICDRHPWRFLRGLVHSDGSRFLNPIKHPNKTYVYPRYTFSNRSDDIRGLFCEYCDKVGVEWRQMNRWNISVARRDSVALMDRFIGPKR